MFGHIDWSQPRDFLEVLGYVGVAVFFVLLLWMREKFVPRKVFDETVKRLDAATAECRLLSDKSANEIKLQIAEQNAVLGRLDERSKSSKDMMERTAEAVARMDGFLLTGRAA